MARLGILTDSTADIPPDLAAELDITVISCLVHLEKRTFLDGVDLTQQALCEMLRHGPPFPTTAPPPVGAFVEAYRKLAGEVDHIVSIHLASRLSALYNVARLASEMVPEVGITLIDSQQISMATGWLAIAAARAARERKALHEVLEIVHGMIPRLGMCAFIQDLQYLHRSGRVDWASALIGAILKVKPLIAIEKGQVNLVEKVRTASQAARRLVEFATARGPLEEAMVIHLGAERDAEEVADRLSALSPGYRVRIAEAGATIGTHAGPGAVGVASVLAQKSSHEVHSEDDSGF